MKQLTRTPDDRWIAGVCGGIADHLGVDATVVRVVVAVCTVLGAGSLILGYLVAWVLMPRRPRTADVWTGGVGNGDVWSGATDAPATPSAPAPR